MRKYCLLVVFLTIGIAVCAQNETVNGNLQVNNRLTGGIGAYTTTGVLDWNDISNATAGSGYSLLRNASALNAPGLANIYYHPFNFEYASKNGSGNITQFAIPYGYSSGINAGLWMRGRYSNTWTDWVKILSENLQGHVGIGTENPTYALDISSSADDYKQLRIKSPGSPLLKLSGSYNGGNGAELWQDASGNIRLNVHSSKNGLLINPNGNIGIGNSSPTYKLDIQAGVGEAAIARLSSLGHANYRQSRGSTSFDGGYLFYTGTTLDWRFQESKDASDLHIIDESTNQKIMTFENNTGHVGIGTTSPTARLDIVSPNGSENSLRIGRLDNANYWGINHAGNDFRLYNSASSGSDILLGVDPGGGIKDNKVGIGTATPVSKLDVNGKMTLSGNAENQIYQATQSIANSQTTNTTIVKGRQIDLYAYDDVVLRAGTTDDIRFIAGGSEKMHLDKDGKVGIGTTTPSHRLDVIGDAEISGRLLLNDDTDSAINIRGWTNFGVTKGGHYPYWGMNVKQNDLGHWYSYHSSLRGSLILNYGNSISLASTEPNNSNSPVTQHLVVNTVNGNVGVGTTSPSNPLDIEKNQNSDVLLEVTNLNTGTGARSGVSVGKSNGNRTFLFATSSNYNIIPSWTNSGVLGTDSGLTGGLVMRTSNGKIRFQPNGTEDKMILDESGNLGIGTANPGSWKLAVNGKIRAKEVKVQTGWSDFVFEDNYDLPTLKEVEKYIEEKGHLKDIPSAKEVAENGILLGQMDSKLLQKIEELTLYTIQQQKTIDGLKAEVSEVKKENTTLKTVLEKLKVLQKEVDALKEKK